MSSIEMSHVRVCEYYYFNAAEQIKSLMQTVTQTCLL